MTSSTTRRPAINAEVEREYRATYACKAQIKSSDTERAKPHPVITPCLLMVFALAVFAVNLAVFGKGAM